MQRRTIPYSNPSLAAILLAASLLMTGSLAAHADVSTTLYASLEQYQWEEYDPTSGAQLMKVSGPQVRVGLNAASHLQNLPLTFAGDAALYQGTMDYSSQTTDVGTGTTIPYNSRIGYAGYNLHLDSIYTGFGDAVQPMLTLGVEGWRRSVDSRIINESVGPVPAIGYAEDWRMLFAKLGLRGRMSKLSWDLGMKLPFSVTNSVDFAGTSVNPAGRLSAYAGFDYTLTSHWQIGLAYEATRFDASASAYSPTLGASVLQPKSDEDLYSLTLRHAF